MPWLHSLQLRYQDLDYLGHVTAIAHHAHFEEARAAWLAEIWETRFPVYVVARQELEYLHEVRLEDSPLTISLAPVRVGESSFDIEERLAAASGDLRTRSRATLVTWDMGDRRPRPMTATERRAVENQIHADSAAREPPGATP